MHKPDSHVSQAMSATEKKLYMIGKNDPIICFSEVLIE